MAAMAAGRRAVVVLPTPPEPQAMTISLAAKSASMVSGVAGRPGPTRPGRHQ